MRMPPVPRAISFDYLVGAGEERRWQTDPKCLGRFEIDDQLESGWLLDRQLARLSANRNLADSAVSARTLLRNKRQSQYTGVGKKPWKAL